MRVAIFLAVPMADGLMNSALSARVGQDARFAYRASPSARFAIDASYPAVPAGLAMTTSRGRALRLDDAPSHHLAVRGTIEVRSEERRVGKGWESWGRG